MTTSSEPQTLLIIDANSLIHRAFHALPPLSAPDGRPAQALYGVASVLLKLWRAERPAYAAAMFDRPEPTFRKTQYAEYKAQRPAAPDELISQIIAAHDLFPKFGVRTFEAPGFEADDLIATLATRFADTPGVRVLILTGDLDTLQLVRDGHIAVRVFRKGVTDTVTYDEAGVQARYNLRADQLIDYKAFVGDASDNVKGVLGVGPKTAAAWLSTYGTLENIITHISKDKALARLKGHEEEARFSKSLVTLHVDAPLVLADVQDLTVQVDEAVLAEYFHALGFQSLAKRLVGGDEPIPAARRLKEPRSGPPQGSMF